MATVSDPFLRLRARRVQAKKEAQNCEMRLQSVARIDLDFPDRLTPSVVEILRTRGYVVEKISLEDGTDYWGTVIVPTITAK